jgi:hypothetical protein
MAISAHRVVAVEEERKIKENELNTEITLEEQRRRLIDLQGENAFREAESREGRQGGSALPLFTRSCHAGSGLRGSSARSCPPSRSTRWT